MTALKQGYGRGFFLPYISQPIRSVRYLSATHVIKSTQAQHSSVAQFVSALLQTGPTKINCTKRLIRRCRALQRAKELRDTVMSRLLEVADLCSSNVSDTANRLLKRMNSEGSSSVAEKKSSAVPLFRSGHMSAICARLSKGKG